MEEEDDDMVPSPSPPLETSDNDTEVFESDQELLLDIDDDFSDDDENNRLQGRFCGILIVNQAKKVHSTYTLVKLR